MSSYQKVKAVVIKINLQLLLYSKNRALRLAIWEMGYCCAANSDKKLRGLRFNALETSLMCTVFAHIDNTTKTSL